MNKFKIHTPLIALVMTAAVAGCGDGGGGDLGAVGGGAPVVAAPDPNSIPASALASVDGLIAFMNQLVDNGTNDTSEPIVLGDASLPVDDTI